MTFLVAAVSVLAVAVASAVSGRLLVTLLPLRRLGRCDPFAAAATTVLGTMVCLLAATALSRLGLSEPRVLVALLVAHGTLVAQALWRRTTPALRPVGAAAGWVALFTVVLLAALAALAPVLLTGGFGLGWDNFIYCAAGEWLQDHPFSEPAESSPVAPVAAVVGMWQQGKMAISASHAVALLTAAGANSALTAYPVASAWAFVLGTLTVVLAARWALRLSPPWAWGVGFAFALLPHPSLWAQHNGFLAQTYGVPGLVLTVAAMGLPARKADASGPVLVGVAAAYTLAIYVPFLPLLGAAGVVWALDLARRRRSGIRRRWWPAIVALVVFVVAAGFEVGLAFRELPGLIAARVGGPIPLSPHEWLTFAMGARAYVRGRSFVDLVPCCSLAAGVAAGVLAVAGCLVAAVRSSSRGLVVALLVLAGLGLWYGGFVADPWTGDRGHTWNVFKTVQWAYPLLLPLQAAGVARAYRRVGAGGVAAVIAVALVLSSAQVPWARGFGLEMRRAVVLTETPLQDAGRIKERLRAMPPGRVVLLGHPASQSPWLAVYAALLAYPRPISLDWEGSAIRLGAADYRADLDRLDDPGLVLVAAGVGGLSDARVEPLGGAYVRLLEPRRPQLAQVIEPRAVARLREGGRRPTFRLGSDGAKLVVIASKPCRARIELETLGTDARPLRAAIQIVPDAVAGDAFRAARRAAPAREVTAPGGSPLVFDVALARGQTTLVVSLLASAATPATAEVSRVTVHVSDGVETSLQPRAAAARPSPTANAR